MKKQSMLRIVGHLTRSLAILLLVIVNQIALQAQTTGRFSTLPDTPNVSVKHLGNDDNNMLFQVFYNNTTGEKFQLVIKDKEDFTVFQESYSDKVFNRRFRIPKPSNERLTFIIRAAKSNKIIQTYEVNTNLRFVQEIVVKKQG